MADQRGRFVWYDLMTSNPDAAKAFYTEALGFGLQAFEGGKEPYTMFTVAGGSPIGGVMKLPDEAKQMGAPPHWLGYVATNDINASVAKAKELGANIVVPVTPIPNVGAFAVLIDPQGAVQGLFAGNQDQALPEKPRIGDVSWHELLTSDLDAGAAFHIALHGWEKQEAMDMGEMGTYQMFGLPGKMLGGMMKKPAELPAPPHWAYYFHVADVNGTTARIQALGGKLVNGPMEVPGGDLIAQFFDPQGAMFAIHGPGAKKN